MDMDAHPPVRKGAAPVPDRADPIAQAKLETISRFAGGVAHDLNNFIGALLIYTESLRELLPDGAVGSLEIDGIRSVVERVASFAKSLQAIGPERQETVFFDAWALDDGIRAMEGAILGALGPECRALLQLGAPAARVEADRGAIAQALLALVANAREAMPSGGTLAIATRETWLDPQAPGFRVLGAPAGRYAEIAVSDTGRGMDMPTLSRAFEPYFTTHAAGRHRGLGLSWVYGIVRRHSGEILVESAPGVGTTMRVYLKM